MERVGEWCIEMASKLGEVMFSMLVGGSLGKVLTGKSSKFCVGV